MTTRIRHKIIVALTLSMAIVVLLGVLAFNFVKDVVAASRFAAHSQLVLFHLQRARTVYVELKLNTAQQNNFVDSVTSLTNAGLLVKMDRLCNALDSLVRDNPSQGALLTRLRTAVSRPNPGLVEPAQESFDVVIDEMQQAEQQLKRERQAAMTKQFYNFIAASVALLFVWIANILVLLLVLNRNLKQRDKAELRLSLAATEIRRLYEHAPCGYFTVNADGIVIKVNQTLLNWLRYENEAIVDKLHITDLVMDEDRAKVREMLVREGPSGGEIAVGLTTKSNGALPVLLTFSRVIQDDRHTVYLFSVVDNTERKKAEEEIKRAYKELEAFSYSVSHDLRAPLRSINGYGQILMEDYGENMDDEGRRVVSVIINNGKRMGQLIDDLLDFSRVSRKEIARTHITMKEFIGSIADEQLEREGDRKVDMKINALHDVPGDPGMLRQVWINLISNALKYSRKKEVTVIEIGSRATDNEVIFFIKDNGAGFSMDYYDKLFGVFQRLHKVQDFEGTGVGLALVKRIIERHGGRIWAEARLGEGATFYYSTPRASTDAAQHMYAPTSREN
jgi:PAS domain S-box-containing protein